MKNKIVITLFLFLLIQQIVLSQDSTKKTGFFRNFKSGGETSLIFNQVSFLNWAKGGENAISATALIHLFSNFNSGNFSWDNTADFKYGLQNTDETGLRTNQDLIDINTKFGYKALKSFYYSGLINFKSQFAPGYKYPNDSLVVARFFAPAYLITSLGFDYKPNDKFSLYLSPMTGKFIFINDTKIADLGTYTSEPAIKDSLGNVIEKGSTLKADFGAYLRINFTMELMKNIIWKSKLELFNNFTDKIINNRSNIDVDNENSIEMKVNEYITANIMFHFIYDHDIKIPIYEKKDGKKTQIGIGPRLQLNEVIGIGIKYSFK